MGALWFCEARRNSLGLSSPVAPLLTLHVLLMTDSTWWRLVWPQRRPLNGGRVTARVRRGLLKVGYGDKTTKKKKTLLVLSRPLNLVEIICLMY